MIPPGMQFSTAIPEFGNGSAIGLMPPVPDREWRGSIVGEICDDGVCKGNEDAPQDDQSQPWSDGSAPIWIPDGNNALPIVAVDGIWDYDIKIE